MEYGAGELRQLEVCSYSQLLFIHGMLPCVKAGTLTHLFRSRPVHGLIFLFKWQSGEEPAGSIVQDSRLDHIFFAKQV